MRVITTERFTRWVTGAGLIALAGLAWSASPPDYFRSAALVAGFVGSAVATALVMRSRAVPSLAGVIATAAAPPLAVPVQRVRAGGAALCPGGERKP